MATGVLRDAKGVGAERIYRLLENTFPIMRQPERPVSENDFHKGIMLLTKKEEREAKYETVREDLNKVWHDPSGRGRAILKY